MRVARIALSIAIAAGANSCDPPNSTPSESVPVECASDAPCSHIIYISESLGRFNADGDDFVIVVMNESDQSAIDRCNDMGGEPIYNPRTAILYCEGIDF